MKRYTSIPLYFFIVQIFLFSYSLSSNQCYSYSNTFYKKSPNKLPRLININSADAKTLALLPGVGSKTAIDIIKFRKENFGFYYNDELLRVPGIGQVKYNKLKDYITVGTVNLSRRFASIRRWTMSEFIDVGINPSLSLKLVLFIKDKTLYNDINDLLKVDGMDRKKLNLIKQRLKYFLNSN